MHDAILAQPHALRQVLRENADGLDEAAARLATMGHVALAGIGTSWHAALVGERLLAHRAGLGHRVRAFHSFELACYGPTLDARTGVIVVTHGGSRRFAEDVLASARAGGGARVVITGKGHDHLADADVTLRTVDQEPSSTHTVSYTTALVLLASLAARLGRDRSLAGAVDGLPEAVADLLRQRAWDELASRHARHRCYWFVGAGPNTATALEAALKVNEAAHAPAIGHTTEQFVHGAWAAVERDDAVVLVAPPGPCRERSLTAARAVRELGAAVLVLGRADDRELASTASELIALPEVDELLSPVLAVVPLQLFTYHVAVSRGVNPDVNYMGGPDMAPHPPQRSAAPRDTRGAPRSPHP
jgi:glucosamine--fructose-6-phosphate aminotransferase (isomerizing)